MFVHDYKLILKTCGTTTLLLCLDKLFEIAKSVGLSGEIEHFFYSRKSFIFPERQEFPHTNWDSEVEFLEKFFKGGSAYSVGKTNGSNWYCYLWEEGAVNNVRSCDLGREPHERSESAVLREEQYVGVTNDYTLEMMMMGLDFNVSLQFTREHGNDENGKWKITERLAKIFKNVQFDDYMFDPWGYSCNGITQSGHYLTVHVTPETNSSYASFETNIPPYSADCSNLSYDSLVKEFISLFKPSRCTLTLFAEKDKIEDGNMFQDRMKRCYNGRELVKEYKKTDKIQYEFSAYELVYYDYRSLS